MAYANRLTGTGLVVTFLPTGGNPLTDTVTLTGDQTTFETDRKVDTVDVTAGNETARAFRPTIESLDWTLTIFDAQQSYLGSIQPRKEGKLSIYKTGVGSGKPVEEFNVLITGYSESYPFDGALEIQITGVRQSAHLVEVGSLQT